MRIALKAPKPLLPLALFALSFAGAMFVLRQPVGAERAQLVPARSASAPLRPETAFVEGGEHGDATGRGEPRGEAHAAADYRSFGTSAEPPVTAVAGTRSIESIGEVIDTLENSLSPDDRVRAIHSLAANARDGVEVTRVRSSLRLAATDEDPDVAARAQEEYEALVERDDR
jgi:hypothetical protein